MKKIIGIIFLLVCVSSYGQGPIYPKRVQTDSITTRSNNSDLPIYGRGTGTVVIEGLSYPTADGSANYYMKTDGSATLSLAQVAFSHLSGNATETQGGTGQTTYATGDILYASASNTLSKLAAGTDGYVLTLASGVPTWAAASGGVTSGSYSPTITDVANTSARSVRGTITYVEYDTFVQVSGAFNITPTSNTTATQVRWTLPVATTFSGNSDATGTGSACAAGTGVPSALVTVYSNSSNNELELSFTSFSSGGGIVVRWQCVYDK